MGRDACYGDTCHSRHSQTSSPSALIPDGSVGILFKRCALHYAGRVTSARRACWVLNINTRIVPRSHYKVSHPPLTSAICSMFFAYKRYKKHREKKRQAAAMAGPTSEGVSQPSVSSILSITLQLTAIFRPTMALHRTRLRTMIHTVIPTQPWDMGARRPIIMNLGVGDR
jgi:hypothetical protein